MGNMRPLDAEERRLANELSVSVAKDGSEYAGKIFSMSKGRLGVCFEGTELPKVSKGERVDLRLDAPGLGQALSESCEVCHHELIGSGCLVGFTISDWDEFLAHLAARSEKFNRRSSRRIVPGSEVRVEVDAETFDSPVKAALVDMSPVGCSLYLGLEHARLLANSTYVRVSLDLPGFANRIHMVAEIRNRDAAGDRVRVGVLFDEQKTEDYHEKKQAIGDYVTEMLRSVQDQFVV